MMTHQNIQNTDFSLRCGEVFKVENQIIIFCVTCNFDCNEFPKFIEHKKITKNCCIENVKTYAQTIGEQKEQIHQIKIKKKIDKCSYNILNNQSTKSIKKEYTRIEESNTNFQFKSGDIFENDKQNFRLVCSFCQLTFLYFSLFTDHINECALTNNNFQIKREIKVEHIDINSTDNDDDNSDKTEYKCDICLIVFPYKSLLLKHKRCHTGEKPFKCDICTKSFSEKATVKRHRLTHTNERPFSCKFCDKSFSQNSNLTAHIRIHTGEKPYHCTVCNKGFLQSSSLIAHNRTHTGERNFQCTKCEKQFADKSALSSHQVVHSDNKPYKCEYCPTSFKGSKVLIKHLSRVHGEEKKYKCYICDSYFKRKSELNEHRLLHNSSGSV